MTVAPGTRLGPYEIVAAIGAGGMGEVYKARDTRLDRSVAVKVLPAEFADNVQLKLRFEREAKTISQLSHPHICTLHDVGHENGVEFLVMELLDGESLADRLLRGPLPLDQVVRYGVEIADALDKAHRAGVVHRDLKPGNIMLTRNGAKLLDFGLARSGAVLLSDPGAATQQTVQKPLTQEGTIVGTFQYMSPEQLEGLDADGRTDIFALGAVLYEMATGRRAFQGASRTSLIAAIVGSQPPALSTIQPLTPPALEHVVERCLAKDPEARWQSAYDVAEELRWIAGAGSQAGVAAPITTRRRNRERLAWLLHLATAAIAIAATWAWLAYRQPARQVIESSVVIPSGYRVNVPDGGAAIAPDTSALACLVTDSRGTTMIAVRSMAANSYRLLAGTEDAKYPFWSADSRQLGFFAEGKLKITDAAGGPVQTIADAPIPRGGSWNADGTIIFAPDANGAIFKVPAAGGAPVAVTKLVAPEGGHRWPSFLADGRHFVYTGATATKASIVRGSIDDPSDHTVVLPGAWYARVSRSGWLIYDRGTAAIVQRFDGSGPLNGNGAVLVENVSAAGPHRFALSAADDGTIAFARGSGFQASQLVWVDRAGREIDRISDRGVFFCPALSHDGRRVAVDMSNSATGNGDIWLYDVARKTPTRLTYDPGNESSPLWSPDDKHIVFVGDSAGRDDLYIVPSGGTASPEALFADAMAKRPTQISHDGTSVIFNRSPNRTSIATDVWICSIADKKARPWLATPFSEAGAQLSPDGRWIAYQSNETGRSEIYVRAFPDSEEKWLISNAGGSMPSWRGDGRELFYVAPDQKMMAVAVRPGKVFEAETPVALFDANVRVHIAKQYDVTPDGSRFLLNRMVDAASAEPVTIVQNWSARLPR